MPGGSVYKTKYMNIHSTIQYIVQYKYMNITKHNKQKIHEKHIHKTLENTKNTENIILNYWVFGLFLSSGILENRKHNVSETESVFVLR
jgi:UDP-N-acetylmuramyl pentapeptide phosphotransferase/UDP-N-acetylglucosamine-1-phosphate transferase